MKDGKELTMNGLLIGESESMQELRELLGRVGRRNNTVLIQGPTGSGKELVARSIHIESRRAGRFVAVNVAAIPGELFESSLFGHIRGAFSGATDKRDGYLRSAAGGTMFLDEIGEMSLMAQAKLLRVLDNHEVTPVGTDIGQPIDLRVVAATNANLEMLVGQGLFRQDLWYRLRGVTVQVPPLRDRLDDLPMLVRHFSERFAHEHQEIPITLMPDAMKVLRQHAWPGNVRELREFIWQLAATVNTPIISSFHVLQSLRIIAAGNGAAEHDEDMTGERIRLQALLDQCDGSAYNVATVLGLAPSTVYRKMHRLGLKVGRKGLRTVKRLVKPAVSDPAELTDETGEVANCCATSPDLLRNNLQQPDWGVTLSDDITMT